MSREKDILAQIELYYLKKKNFSPVQEMKMWWRPWKGDCM